MIYTSLDRQLAAQKFLRADITSSMDYYDACPLFLNVTNSTRDITKFLSSVFEWAQPGELTLKAQLGMTNVFKMCGPTTQTPLS